MTSASPRPRPPRTPPPATASAKINIATLVETCAAAASKANAVILAVQRARDGGAALPATFKVASDPKSALTLADKRSQAAILAVLRDAHPEIAIVAEEDEEGDFDLGKDEVWGVEDGRTHGREEEMDVPPGLQSVDSRDVCVFVDPVDSTLSFFKAVDLEPVQVLIGIAVNGRAVAAAIGIPFHPSGPRVVRAVVGVGVRGLPSPSPPPRTPIFLGGDNDVTITSSWRHGDAAVAAAEAVIGAAWKEARTGAGNKMCVVAADGGAHVTLLSRVSSLWDSCATEAVVRAAGGEVSDLTGVRIVHAPGVRVGNVFGVVATCAGYGKGHAALCAEMRAASVVDSVVEKFGLEGGGAVDLARDVSDEFLAVDWLSRVVGFEVAGYAALEKTAVRGPVSAAVRLVLTPVSALVLPVSVVPRSVFYKRVVRRLGGGGNVIGLRAKAACLEAEAAFLGSDGYRQFTRAGGRAPCVYNVSSRRPFFEETDVLTRRWAVLCEDYSPSAGWKQTGKLEGVGLRAALSALADLHAFFWVTEGRQDRTGLRDSVRERSSLLAGNLRPSADAIVAGWAKHRVALDPALAGVTAGSGNVTLDSLGDDLARVAEGVRARVHGSANGHGPGPKTVLHGNARASNFFMRRQRLSGDGRNAVESEPEVGMVGFKWCGLGHPMTDVAFLLSSAAGMEELSEDGLAEACTVAFYTSCLSTALVKHGKVDSEEDASRLLPLSDALEYYDDCVLDIAAWVIGSEWSRIGASVEVLKSRESMMGSCTFSKDVDHARWLVFRAVALLEKVTSS